MLKEQTSALRPFRILILEGDVLIGRMYNRFIQINCERQAIALPTIDYAQTSERAFELVQAHQYQLMIVDGVLDHKKRTTSLDFLQTIHRPFSGVVIAASYDEALLRRMLREHLCDIAITDKKLVVLTAVQLLS